MAAVAPPCRPAHPSMALTRRHPVRVVPSVAILICVYFEALIFIILNASIVGVLFARVAAANRRASQIIFSDKAVIRCVRNRFYFMLQVALAAPSTPARVWAKTRRQPVSRSHPHPFRPSPSLYLLTHSVALSRWCRWARLPSSLTTP